MILLEGYGIGLAMIIFIGPVFFLLLNSSLQYGTNAGLAVAFGILLSDIICVLLCYFGLHTFTITATNQFWIGLLGSIILLGLGISYLLKQRLSPEKILLNKPPNSKNLSALFIKGFSVNFFNPFVFVVWIGVFQYANASFSKKSVLIPFLITVLLGILTTDVLKVFVAKYLRKHLSPEKLTSGYKITGIILILFAIRLLYIILFIDT